MTAKSVAIRVGVEGEADIERKLAKTGDVGSASFDRIGAAALKASADATRGADGVAAAVDRQTSNVVKLGRQQDAQMRAYNNFLREQEAHASKLRDAVDPLGAATRAYEKELAQVRVTARVTAMAEHELAAAEALVRKRFDETTAAIKRRAGAGTGLSAQGKTNMLYQGTDVVTSLAGGMNPGMVALQQGGQVMGILAAEGIKVSGAMIAAAAGVGVLTAAVVGGTAVVVTYEQAQASLRIATAGLGRTAGLTATDLEKLALAGAEAANVSVSGARNMATAYVETGRIGGAVLGDLVGLTRDYAITTRQEAKEATGELAAAFAKPAEGVALLNQRLSFLTAAEQEHIQNLARAGREADAQRLMVDKLAVAISGAAGQVSAWDRMWHNMGVTAANALDGIARRLTGGGPEGRLALLQRQLENELNSKYSPGLDRSDVIARLRRQIAALQTEIDAPAKQGEESRLKQLSVDTRASFNSLNPQQAQIDAVRANQARMRAALADPKLLAASGLTAEQTKAAIAAGDRQIEQLGRRAAGTARVSESTIRNTAAMIANTAAGYDLAKAYLLSSEAGLKAEAVRKGLTDATRKGTDTQAQANRQLALDISEAAVAGAKLVDQLRGQTDAQKAVNAAVAAGTLTAEQADEAMAIELAVRPLIVAQTHADAAAKATLAKVVDALRKGMTLLNDEQGRAQMLVANDNDRRRTATLQKELELVQATNRERAEELAVFEAEQELKAKKIAPEDPIYKDRVQSARDLAKADADLSAGRAAESIRRDQERSLELLDAELTLLGRSDAEHARVIGQLQLKQRLLDSGVELLSKEGRLILENAERIDSYNEALRRESEALANLQQLGGTVIDELGMALDPDQWGSWREAGMNALKEIGREFIKLAMINPLKNQLLGTDAPTLKSSGGWLSKALDVGLSMFTGGRGGVGGHELAHAGGTSFSPGGLALVGENGPEVLRLPRGSAVHSSSETSTLMRKAMRGGDESGGGVQISIPITLHAEGAGPREVDALKAEVRQLKADMPGIARSAVNDGLSRRTVTGRAG